MVWFSKFKFFFTVQLEPVKTPDLHITDDLTECVFNGVLKGYLGQDFKNKKIQLAHLGMRLRSKESIVTLSLMEDLRPVRNR